MDGTSPETAVVVYSRTGHSRRVATRLATELGARLIELNAPTYGSGPLGYMRAGYDSLRQTSGLSTNDIPPMTEYTRVVLCGPVWTSYPATPLRAFLKNSKDLPNSVSLFLTNGDHSPARKAFETAEKDLGRSFAALGSLSNAKEGTQEEDRILNDFLRGVKTVAHLPH